MNKDHQPKKTEQSARTGKKTGKGRRIGRTVGIVLGTILLVIVLTSSIFVGIFMTYVNTSLKGHVEVDMSEYDQKVSTELYYQDPETKQTVMYQTLFGDENRIWVDFDSIPKVLRDATIAIEDKRFETHHGVDWHGTLRAVFSTLTNGNTQGGSTITQQLIKNVTGNNENTVKRKVTGGVPGPGPGEGLQQGRDPGDVPEHHLSGQPVLRCADGVPDVLPQGRVRAGPG